MFFFYFSSVIIKFKFFNSKTGEISQTLVTHLSLPNLSKSYAAGAYKPQTIEDKTTSEKIRLVQQLEEEDRNVVFKVIDSMLTKNKFKQFFSEQFGT